VPPAAAAHMPSVDGARDELLAGAALADDEHGRHRPGDAIDAREDLAHAPRSADHALEDERAAGRVVVVRVGLAHVVRGEQLADEGDEARRIQRLLQVVRGAELQRLDGRVHRAATGDHDDGGRRLLRLGRVLRLERREALHQVHPGHPGQIQIGHEHVGGRALVDVERLLAARRDHDVEPLVPQHRLEDRGLIRLVLDQQHTPLVRRMMAAQRPQRTAHMR
jgi:hypothetical protein